jgi:hypothetical protein
MEYKKLKKNYIGDPHSVFEWLNRDFEDTIKSEYHYQKGNHQFSKE